MFFYNIYTIAESHKQAYLRFLDDLRDSNNVDLFDECCLHEQLNKEFYIQEQGNTGPSEEDSIIAAHEFSEGYQQQQATDDEYDDAVNQFMNDLEHDEEDVLGHYSPQVVVSNLSPEMTGASLLASSRVPPYTDIMPPNLPVFQDMRDYQLNLIDPTISATSENYNNGTTQFHNEPGTIHFKVY